MAALLLLAIPGAGRAQGAPPAIGRLVTGSSERLVLPLGGALVTALALPGHRALLLLVRPVADLDGDRRLVRLDLGADPVVTELAGPLGGWTKSLAAIDLGRGLELVTGGLERLDSLGPLAAPTAAGRRLVDHGGFDLRSLAPDRLKVGASERIAAAEVGALRIWTADGAGGLALDAETPVPFTVERTETGLRLDGARVVPLADPGSGVRRFAIGPEAVGARRLRVVVLEERGGVWSREEAWAALPAPEKVEESWFFELDGEPVLVARTQDGAELNLFESQRWRVWRLATDRTRAGRSPLLAVEVDSKRWHANRATVADVDGDGHDDLIVARPEGLSGSDLVVEARRGTGAGRLEARARRSDVDGGGRGWLLLGARETGGPPALAVRSGRGVELRRFRPRGRRLLEREPALIVPLPEAESVSGGGFEWLGAVPRPESSHPTLLLLAADDAGAESLVVIRARQPAAARSSSIASP